MSSGGGGGAPVTPATTTTQQQTPVGSGNAAADAAAAAKKADMKDATSSILTSGAGILSEKEIKKNTMTADKTNKRLSLGDIDDTMLKKSTLG